MIPKKEADLVTQRSGGMCEAVIDGERCESVAECFAHIEHRGMGGRKGKFLVLINDHRNLGHLCVRHHDILDNRIQTTPKIRLELYVTLKRITGWFETWLPEYTVARRT